MKTQSTFQRTLQALLISGISVFAVVPAYAADAPKVTADNYVRAESDFAAGWCARFPGATTALGLSARPATVYDLDEKREPLSALYIGGNADLYVLLRSL